MARGTPDWSLSPYDIHILREDLAELAARLSSINVFDRRGNVVWMDDFARGKGAWNAKTYGTSAAVVLETSHPLWPPYCVKLTGGSDSTRKAVLEKYLAGWGAGGLGLEVSVAFPTSFDKFEVTFWYQDGALSHYAVVGLSDTDDEIYYKDAATTSQKIDDLLIRQNAVPNYNNLKLVIDPDTNKYIRLILNSTEYDLSAYSFLDGALVTGPTIYVALSLVSRSGQNDHCLIDGIIVTQGEA